jgi:REP element-mobilizing transposase RayT
MAELFYRTRLPHWRQDYVTYFVTWRLARGQQELDSNERDLVTAAIRKFDGQCYELAAYVVMDDHVHALLAPLAPYELESIPHSWKSFTARQMQQEHKRFGRFWQDEYFDRIVRDDQELLRRRLSISSEIRGNDGRRSKSTLGYGRESCEK